MDIKKTLCSAIKSKVLVNFRYADEDTYRVFAPYIIYKLSGNILVSGTQFRDYKKLKSELEPRKFDLSKISFMRVTNIPFKYDNRFNPARDEYKDKICIISQK